LHTAVDLTQDDDKTSNPANLPVFSPRTVNDSDAEFFKRKKEIGWLTMSEAQLHRLCPRRYWQHSTKMFSSLRHQRGWHTVDHKQPQLHVSDEQLKRLTARILQQIPLEKLVNVGFPLIAVEQWISEGSDSTDPHAGFVFYDIATAHSVYLTSREELILVYGLGAVSAASETIRKWDDIKPSETPMPRARPLLAGSAAFRNPRWAECYDFITDLICDMRCNQEPDVEPLLKFLAACEPKLNLHKLYRFALRDSLLLVEDIAEIESLIERYKQSWQDVYNFEQFYNLSSEQDAKRFETETSRYYKRIPTLAIEPRLYGPNNQWSTFDLSGQSKLYTHPVFHTKLRWEQLVADNHNPPKTVKELRKISRYWLGGPGKVMIEAKATNNQAVRAHVELIECRLCHKKRVIYATATQQQRSDYKCGETIGVNQRKCGDNDEHLIHGGLCSIKRNSTEPCPRKHHQWVIQETTKNKSGKRVSYVN
jgi:hypothetical protein